MQIAQIGGRIAGISINPHGAVIEGVPLEHTYEEAMRQISVAERTCKFALGDLLVSATAHYGDKYARWAEVTGFEVETLYNIASTCRRVPIPQRRVGSLSFTHHAEVAALSVADQSKWLALAEEKEIGSARLRKSIQLGRVATASDMGRKALPPSVPASVPVDGRDAGFENVHPHINRLVTYLSKKERDGDYEDMSAEELYRFHLDVLPAVRRWGRLVSRIREHYDAVVNAMLADDVEKLGVQA